MIDEKLIEMLVCPIDRTPLGVADEGTVARLNRAIATGGVKDRAGRPVQHPIKGGLIRADKTLLYPIQDAIPVLLADEAIPLAQIE